MIVYDTVKTEKPMSPLVLKIRGKEGWILGGVAQAESNLLSNGRNGIPGYPTIYYYHFWKKKEQS